MKLIIKQMLVTADWTLNELEKSSADIIQKKNRKKR